MFDLKHVDPSWRKILTTALASMDQDYLLKRSQAHDWLPGPDKIFNAFSIPLSATRYLLLGESPYPREASANGYAFWDGAVSDLWSTQGLTKPVNRATSLRNIMKMLLLCTNKLNPSDVSQAAIANLDKKDMVATLPELFQNLLDEGFLLLNASLILSNLSVTKESHYWQPFLRSLLEEIAQETPSIKLILLGNIAKKIEPLLPTPRPKIITAEHPYNLSFVTNPVVQELFKSFNLLKKRARIRTRGK